MVAVGGTTPQCGSGVAEVYTRSSNETNISKLRGNAITAPPLWRNLAASYSPPHPYYVSLSGNGERLALGMIESMYCPTRTDNLITQVYRIVTKSATIEEIWSPLGEAISYQETIIEEMWSPLGDAISKQHYVGDPARSLLPLQSLTLSDDAMVLAISSLNSVDVFSWNDTVYNWIQREVDLEMPDSSMDR